MIRLLVAASLFLASPAWACLEHSFPEHGSEVHIDDNRVELEFTDVVDIATVAATVTDEKGRQVSTGDLKRGDDNKTVYVMLRAQDSMGYEAGLYVVTWRVGHGDVEHQGKFTFRVHKH